MPIPMLPPSAPFAPTQRAWLNGFFAGVLSLDPQAAGGAADGAVTGTPQINNLPLGNGNDAVAAVEAEEEFPWHDPALPINERMQLAEGKPIERVLMAAMAQLDCGNCGYMCKTYAEAIAQGQDKSLTKCTPGGKETAKKLKEIMAAAPVG